MNNTIIYFGGQKRDPKTGNETGNIAKAWKLDLSSTNPKWVRVKDMPGARNHFGLVVIRKYVYAVGGQSGGDEMNGIKTPAAWNVTMSQPILGND